MRRESAKIGSGTFANPSQICEYSTQTHVKSARIRVGIPSRHPWFTRSPSRAGKSNAHRRMPNQ
eukprot:3360472-Prymnesium_polylepis.1